MPKKNKDTKDTKKIAVKESSTAEAVKVKTKVAEEDVIDLDALVEKKKTSGTDFQAYMRDCIKAGRLL